MTSRPLRTARQPGTGKPTGSNAYGDPVVSQGHCNARKGVGARGIECLRYVLIPPERVLGYGVLRCKIAWSHNAARRKCLGEDWYNLVELDSSLTL